MIIKNLLRSAGILLVVIIALASCEQDISSVGSSVLGSETPNGILDDSQTVVAYSRKLGPVQSNQLPAYQLGVYKDPVYGKSTVSLLSQLRLMANNPKFGDSARVDSVFVYLPYYSKATTVDTITTYTLDSVYGSAPINVSIYESKYFLRDLDPYGGFEEPQPYYSDQGPIFNEYKGAELAKVEDFKVSPNGFVFEVGEKDRELLAPGMRIKLPSSFFQEKIIDKEGSPELQNNNNFKNYFRGLYFQVGSHGDDGTLFIFDVTKADVTIHYSFKKADAPDEWGHSLIKLGLGNVSVNTFSNRPVPSHILAELQNPDTINGNQNLYLRGGDGIISVVELFGKDSDNNGVADELELLRAKKWLINEANLIFYVNQDLIAGGSTEPERIMIYDLKNSNVLADYNLDPTNGLEPINALSNHFGRLQRGSDGNGQYYKLKITNHISNLINKDSTNVPLGVVVSQNVSVRTTQKLLNKQKPHIEKVPASMVVSPEGTILYGNSSSNDEKRLKLQIYYTEPN
ncbi:MAG: DUF4270 domain-containing protein [Aequorivita sp.]